MIKAALWTIGLCLLAAPSLAAGNISINRDACAQLVRHVPTPDVAYQPGVDAYGRPVASADVAPPQLQMPPVITIPLSAYLAKDLGIPDAGLSNSAATIGVVRVEGNDVTFNGQPLGAAAEENLAILCMRANPG